MGISFLMKFSTRALGNRCCYVRHVYEYIIDLHIGPILLPMDTPLSLGYMQPDLEVSVADMSGLVGL